MASKWYSKLASDVIQQDDLQDIRNKLKSYSARRFASFAKCYFGEKDNSKSPPTQEESTYRMPIATTKSKRRPGKEPLVEVVKPQPVSSHFDSKLARMLTAADKENHNYLHNPDTSLKETRYIDRITFPQPKSIASSKSKSKSKLISIASQDLKRLLANSNDPPKCSSQEAWLNAYIRTYRTIEFDYENRSATTHIIARFSPKDVQKPIPANRYVEVEYKFNIKNNSEIFEKRGPLESLLPIPGEDSMESLFDERIYQPDVDLFFQNFDYFINNLEGIVWWNGFNISASGHRDNRLPIHDFDMEPGKIVLSLEGIKEVNIIRDHIRLELRAEDLDGKLKWFRLKGDHISLLKVTGPKDGTFIIEFPEYPLKPKAIKPNPPKQELK